MKTLSFQLIGLTAAVATFASEASASNHLTSEEFGRVAMNTTTPITYDFNGGDLQGWVTVLTSTTSGGPTEFAAYDPTEPWSFAPVVGDSIIAPTPFGTNIEGDRTRDYAHQTLVLRSPEFRLDGSGGIAFSLSGGTGAAISPGADFGALPGDSSSTGFMGVAVRRVSDGAYVMAASRENNGQAWEVHGFSEQALTSYVSETESYTLDLIDTFDGNWGWIAMDAVSISGTVIPEPSTYALILGGLFGGLVVLRRRFK